MPATHTHVHRKSFPLIALNLAIVLIVAGGTAAYGAFSKTVTLTIDGESHSVRTFGDSVSDVLSAKSIDVRDGDRLTPSASAPVEDGDEITVRYAKPITLAVDGEVKDAIVHDATVGDVLDRYDVEVPDGAYLSAPVDSKVPRNGAEIVVSSVKELTVKADGEKETIRTSAPTVGGVLKAADITLDHDDEVKPAKSDFVAPDDALKVTRIEKLTKTETVDVKFPVEVQKDDDAMQGEKTIVEKGEVGQAEEKVNLILADGKVREREVITSRTLSEPRPQIEKHGTQTTPPDSVWDKIAQCESGGNWSINTGNGYYGGLQFSAATWRSVGGPGLPHQHSRETQIKYAKILQARSGWGQWGCAHARH